MQKALAILILVYISCIIPANAQYVYELQPHYECGYDAAIHSNEAEIKAMIFAKDSTKYRAPFDRANNSAMAWTWNGVESIRRVFINFPDLQYLLNWTDDVEYASLKLYMIVGDDYPTEFQTNKYVAHETRGYCNLVRFTRITEAWDKTINWENQPGLAEGQLFSDYVEGWENECECTAPLCKAYENIEVDLTEMTQWWHQNPEQIFGVQFRLVEEFIYNRKCFTSSNSNQVNEHPVFKLETSNEIRFFEPVYYIAPGETFVIGAPINNATYNWNGEGLSNDYFVINEPGNYDVSITLPNCFTIRNEFEVRHKIISPISFPISTAELEGGAVEEVYKPIKGRPSTNNKSITFTLFNSNGTPIYQTNEVPQDIYELKSQLPLGKGLYLYKTTEQDLTRHTIITKSGKFYQL